MRVRRVISWRHVLGDVVLLSWAVLWWFVARALKTVVDALAAPLTGLSDQSETLSRRIDEAGRRLGELPLLGADVASAFDSMARAFASLAAQTDAQVESVHMASTLMFWALWAMPTLTLALLYLPGRIRRARETAAAVRYLRGHGDLELFALRALVDASTHTLGALPTPPVAGWRSLDEQTIRTLAALELGRLGIVVEDDRPTGSSGE
jgi:hypothetical protein